MHTLELGGRTFAVTPNTRADYAAMLPAFRKLTGQEWPEGERLRAAIASRDGVRAVLAVMLGKSDPSVTAAQIAEWVPDQGTAHDISSTLGPILADTGG